MKYENKMNIYDGLLPLVAVGLAPDEEC